MLGRKIAFNTIISAGARIIGLALSLVIIGLISRYLGQDGFGYYSTILAFLFFFNSLADLGLYSICLREISRPKADEVKVISNAFTLKFVSGLFIFALSPIIVYLFPYPVEVKVGVLIGAVGFWLMSNQHVLIGIFQKYLRMDKVALAEVMGRLVQLGLVLFFVKYDFDFLYIVSALVFGSLVNFILLFLFGQKYIRISFEFDFKFWKSLLKESLPLALAIVFTMIYFKVDTIMLSLMKPVADVGIYNLAYKFLESLLFFPAMFVGLVMPLMSEYAFSAKKKFRKIIQRTSDILLIFAIPMVIGVIFLSENIVVLIAGPDFILSAGVLNILIVAAGIIFLGVLFSNMIIVLKKQKSLTYIYGAGVIVNLIANYIFIPKYSYYGAAWTTLLTELIVTILMLFVIKNIPSFRFVYKYVLAGLVMALVLYYFSSLPLFVLIILSIFVYFGVLFLIKGFSGREVLYLIKKDV